MRERRTVTWPILRTMAQKLATTIEPTLNPGLHALYGVPRGGIPVALLLEPLLTRLKIVDQIESGPGTLVVDDICDSGETLGRYAKAGCRTATLFGRPGPRDDRHVIVQETDEWIHFPWEGAEPHGEDVVRRMIELIGDDPTRPGLRETPGRVVRAWTELFAGYAMHEAPKLASFDETYDQMVVVKGVEFVSFCEHHMIPFFGHVAVGYVPDGKVLGLSKVARLVEYHSRRLQIQERMTQEIAAAIAEAVHPKGVAVVVSAQHLCMIARGVKRTGSWATTSEVLGVLREKPEARAEFFALLRNGQK